MDNTNDTGFMEPPSLTVTCGSCHRAVSKWTALLLQQEQAHDDEIEVIDAEAVTALCGYCTEHLLTKIRLAVEAVVNPVKAA
jgi:hypothetical protein